MTEAEAIAAFLAKGGTVTKCPPRTFSEDASASFSWRKRNSDTFARQRAAAAAKRRLEKTVETAAVLVQVGPVVSPEKLKKVKPKRVKVPKARAPRQPRTDAGRVPIEDIKAMIVAGMTCQQLAERLGCPVGSVSSRLRRAGVQIGKLRPRTEAIRAEKAPRKRLPDADIRDAVATRTAIDAALHLGISERYLRARCKELGVSPLRKVRKAKPRNAALVEPIVAAVESGMTLNQTADSLGIRPHTVHARLARAGMSVTTILRDYHRRVHGSTAGAVSGRVRGAKMSGKAVALGSCEWPSRREAAAALGINLGTLKHWLKRTASPSSREKLAMAVAAYEASQRRIAA